MTAAADNRKEDYPVFYKILHFLLLYTRYEDGSTGSRTREKKETTIRNYLLDEKQASVISFENLFMIFRYLPNNELINFRTFLSVL